jgi:hypothetical protein
MPWRLIVEMVSFLFSACLQITSANDFSILRKYQMPLKQRPAVRTMDSCQWLEIKIATPIAEKFQIVFHLNGGLRLADSD